MCERPDYCLACGSRVDLDGDRLWGVPLGRNRNDVALSFGAVAMMDIQGRQESAGSISPQQPG
jgi:hypothetical protein